MQDDTIITYENLNEDGVDVENRNSWSSDWKEIRNLKIEYITDNK